jgi:hypothetical protein
MRVRKLSDQISMKIGDTARFWLKVNKTPADSDCWLWTASINRHGYGRFTIFRGQRRITIPAHRYAMELTIGAPVASEMLVLHKPKICRARACVNPSHLYIGTPTQNNLDKIVAGTDHNARKAHCPRGHPYDIIRKGRKGKGTRWCKQCLDANRRASYHRNKLKCTLSNDRQK